MKHIPDAYKHTHWLHPSIALGMVLNGLVKKSYSDKLDYTLRLLGRVEGSAHAALLTHNTVPDCWCLIHYGDNEAGKLRFIDAKCSQRASNEWHDTPSITHGTPVIYDEEYDAMEKAAQEAEHKLYGAQNEQSR